MLKKKLEEEIYHGLSYKEENEKYQNNIEEKERKIKEREVAEKLVNDKYDAFVEETNEKKK